MRIEFLFTSFIGEHPQAMMAKGKSAELVDKLAEGIGIVGKAFFPRPIIHVTDEFFRTSGHEEFLAEACVAAAAKRLLI